MKFPQVLTTFGLVASTLIGVGAVAQFEGTSQAAEPVIELDVRAVAGVPGDATAAVLNIAAAQAQSAGYVTAWPCDQAEPATASLNYRPGAAVSNSTVVSLSAAGTVCLSRSSAVELIVDINSAFSAGAFLGQNPQRLIDTRNSQPLAPGQRLAVNVGGQGAIPADASAAVVNIAAARAASDGYLTAWPCGDAKPSTSSVNYRSGPAVSNTTTVALGTNGQICIESSSQTDVIVDVNGSFAASGDAPFAPQRIVDTRTGNRQRAGSVLEVQVAGQPGVPGDANAAAINITAARTGGVGYVVAWPCGGDQPVASSLNYDERPTSNSTIIGLGHNGTICLSPSTDVDLIVDLNEAFPTSANITSFTPTRIIDTRPVPQPPSGGGGSGASPRPTGPGWIETFDTPGSVNRLDVQIHHRSDHDAQQNLPSNTWPGDHGDLGGGACTGPTVTRTLDAPDRNSNTYWCDVGTGHFMTSMGDVDGYSTISMSPKQTFTTVSEVCWDQNVTDMGGRQWTEVLITPADAIPTFNGETHLGHVNVEFEPVDQTSTPHGPGAFGAKFNSRYDGNRLYHDRVLLDHNPYYSTDTEGHASTAIRRQHCLTDNNNGTVTVVVDQGPGNAPYERTVPGSFPRNARVIFEDHNYTPDKDGDTNGHYTWHWDNFIVR